MVNRHTVAAAVVDEDGGAGETHEGGDLHLVVGHVVLEEECALSISANGLEAAEALPPIAQEILVLQRVNLRIPRPATSSAP